MTIQLKAKTAISAALGATILLFLAGYGAGNIAATLVAQFVG